MIQDHKQLIVWQKAMDLVVQIYAITKAFPNEEIYGLTSQLRRAAVSIPANIAEGRSRGSRKDFRQFLIVAFGSANELQTHIEIADRLGYIPKNSVAKLQSLLLEILKMLKVIIEKLKS